MATNIEYPKIERMLKPSEVSKIFSCSSAQIYRMAATGAIPSYKIGGLVRFKADEIAAFLVDKCWKKIDQ